MESRKDSASPPRIPWWPLALLGTLLFFSRRSKSQGANQGATKVIRSHYGPEIKGGLGQSDPPIVPEIIPAPVTQTLTYRCEHETPRWKKRLEYGAVFVALGLLVVNILQMRATQNAVDKSKEANDINREALYAVQRAFIIQTKPTTELTRYDVINGVRQKQPLRRIEFIHHWENVGNTPAIEVTTGVGKVVQADDITEDEFMLYGHVDQTSAKAALGPRATFDSGTLSDDETFLTDSPESPRFMWGWTVYRDTFPNTKTHVTEFCWKITQVAWKLDNKGRRTEEKPNLTASACARHNCVDEFCEDYADIAKSPTHQ